MMEQIKMNVISGNVKVALLGVSLLMAVSAFAQSGGDYYLNWSTIDAGGSRSTGGDYVVVGTIGQPDAGEMSGGDYEISGGFWPRGPLLSCFVDFEHFAQFALYWQNGPCGPANNWCEGADLDWSTDVGLSDVRELAYWWLTECPLNWPWE